MDSLTPPSDQGKMWAAVSYGALVFWLPLGIIPLLQRDDAYALSHAKTATAAWLIMVGSWVLVSIVATVTCGFGIVLYPIPALAWVWSVVIGIHGLILSLNGESKEPIGAFGLGEKIFGSIKPKDALSGE